MLLLLVHCFVIPLCVALILEKRVCGSLGAAGRQKWTRVLFRKLCQTFAVRPDSPVEVKHLHSARIFSMGWFGVPEAKKHMSLPVSLKGDFGISGLKTAF